MTINSRATNIFSHCAMKVIDLLSYKKQMELLVIENKLSRLYSDDCPGIARDLKSYFKQWLDKSTEVEHDRKNPRI